MNENKANFAKIGFFVLAGTALIALAIGIAGARTFNKQVVEAETYFAESVAGLDLGSAVKYRGVPVGEVKRIGFVYCEYGKQRDDLLTKANAREILVVMELDPECQPVMADAQQLRQVIHVTLPGIMPTIAILLILRIGSMMGVGYEKIILLYNGLTYETADVISSYVYRKGVIDANFSFSTAVNLFNSIINFLLVVLANKASALLTENSLW